MQAIAISNILIHSTVLNMVKKYGGVIENYMENNCGIELFPLNFERLKSIQESESIPPILVYSVGKFYSVVDGRHRLASAILAGDKYISAKVIENIYV